MLSKKMTFSLMSLITLLAFAFAVPSAMAAEFETTLSYDEAENVDGQSVDVTITFDQVVSESSVQAKRITVTVVLDDFSSIDYTVWMTGAAADLAADATTLGTALQGGFGPVVQKDLDPTTPLGQYDGKTFTFTIPADEADPPADPFTYLPRADDPDTPVVENRPAANKIYVSIPAGIPSLDPANADTSKAATMAIDLRTVAATPDRDTPAVVSVQRLRPGSQTVVAAFQEAAVTGAFEVRIVLSEAPAGDFNPKIAVANGTKSGYVVGAPFAWVGNRTATTASPPSEPIQGTAVKPHPIEGKYNHDGVITEVFGDSGTAYGPLVGVPEGLDEVKVPLPTGPKGLYWQCRITVTPHRRAADVTVSIGEFHDGDAPRNYYYPAHIATKPNGREQLKLAVAIPAFNLEDGLRVVLPHGEAAQITYANSTVGHYILTTNKDGSHINWSAETDENKATVQTPAQLLYNVRATDKLPNLETFLANSGIIHLVSYGTHAAGSAYISEVMWGTDASQDPVNKSNWIEIRNGTSAAIGIGDQIWALWFYEAHETPATAYPANSAYEGPIGQVGTIIDVIGTKDAKGLTWSIAGKGQNGRSNIDIARRGDDTIQAVVTPTTPLISMYRMMDATDPTVPADGQTAASWVGTQAPAVNLAFGRENAIVATPGSAPITTAEQVAAVEKKEEDTAKAASDKITNTGTIPQAGSIYISEIMFAGGGVWPQWIEISNGSKSEEVNLSGWTLTVDNAAADADVSIGASAKFTIADGTTIDPSGQQDSPSTILVVTEAGRNNVEDSGQVLDLMKSNEVDLILAGVVTRKYTLLSGMAFMVTLAPPEPAKSTPPAGETVAAKATRQAAEKKAANVRKAATDMVGNLGADGAAAWALPMDEDGRSSIIRRHVQVAIGPAEPEDGTMEANWVLASDTSFAAPTHIRASSYYGAANDVGTPGFRAGGALPVELSQFRPARDKVTGAVVITWSTQSELNNAGFFIKRSQQRDGEFKVINATMIAGAGTTSEKQFYTYQDTTAQPNVVYYYQIEDVSLDGNRQTLTNGIRLKGHVSVAGKLTTLWGDLKTSQ